jgi:hypothetical protein
MDRENEVIILPGCAWRYETAMVGPKQNVSTIQSTPMTAVYAHVHSWVG